MVRFKTSFGFWKLKGKKQKIRKVSEVYKVFIIIKRKARSTHKIWRVKGKGFVCTFILA